MFDEAWAQRAKRACDPVFDAAGVGFVDQVGVTDNRVTFLLWEADPLLFAARFPDSGIEESYGDQWPAPCIDYWVYLEENLPTQQCRISCEGWSLPDEYVELAGDGRLDGATLASIFPRILIVNP